MERDLRSVPDLARLRKDATTSREQQPERGKGLGKGRPGCVRKPKVTKRQERRRADPEFETRKRRASPSSSAPPAPKRIAPRPTSTEETSDTSSTGTDSTGLIHVFTKPCGEQSTSSEQQKQTETVRPTAPEERQTLTAQTFEPAAKSQVRIIQDFAHAVKESAPNSREIELFWWVMHNDWVRLERSWQDCLTDLWREICDDTEHSLIDNILLLSQLPNGITNCTNHFIGNLLYSEAHKQDRLGNTTDFFEELQQNFSDKHYEQCIQVLRSCSCPDCESVILFDERYERYSYKIWLQFFYGCLMAKTRHCKV